MKPKTDQQTDNKQADTPEVPTEKPKGMVRENLEAIIIALLLALFIRAFLVQPFKIPSGSMENTLLIGDQIFVSKFSYGVRLPFTNKVIIPTGDPERGDIVVFKYPKNPRQDFVKRVVALPGDEYELIDGIVFINGKRHEKQWGLYQGPENLGGRFPLRNYGPLVVPEDKLFVMGDNRDRSNDSRGWGFVPYENLRGRAFMIYYSKDKHLFDVRWNRIAKILH